MSKNILIIVADDMGQEQLEVYGTNLNADNYPSTPNIHALTQRGLRFTRAYTQPWCSPTRAELLTGAYGFQTGIGNLADRQNQPLLETEVCLPLGLKQATENGYATALIGKHHLSTNLAWGGAYEHPVRIGFDYWAGTLLNFLGTGGEGYYSWNRTVSYRRGSKIVVETAPCITYTGLQNVQDALAWIADQTKPWFMQFAFNLPHAPFTRPPAYMYDTAKWDLPTYRPETGGDARPYYKAMIESMDYCIGLLFAGMPQDVLANTVVIFASDNGTPDDVIDPEYIPYNTPNHFKNSPYEEGIRNPLIVAGPGVFTGGAVNTSALVKTIDIYRTVIDIAGGDYALVSVNPEHGRPSISYWPVCTGATTTARSVIWTDNFSPNGPNLNCSTLGSRCLVQLQYKIIRDRSTGVGGWPASPIGTGNSMDKLFDLKTDPLEQTNLIAGSFNLTALEPTHPGIVSAYNSLVASYATWTSTYA